MRTKRSAALILLAALSLALTGAGVCFTWNTPNLLQYSAIAPQSAEELFALVEERETALSDMADAVKFSCVTAIRTGSGVTAQDAGTSAQATLVAGGEGMLAVYPCYLIEGRLLSETELKRGEKVALLDEDLSFALFPTTGAIDRTISVGGADLRVVGVVRHSRGIGERDLYNVYAPLKAVANASFEVVVLTVAPNPGSGAEIMFPTTAQSNWYPGGSAISLQKEVTRARMPLRVSACLAGIALILLGLRLWNRFAMRRVADIRGRLEKEYLPRVLPVAVLYGLFVLIGYAAIVACMYFLASFIVAPLYVFTEWVPENLVKWSAIRAVFWNLAKTEASLVRAATPEARAIAFWGGVLRWGVFLLFAAGLLALLRRRCLERIDRR